MQSSYFIITVWALLMIVGKVSGKCSIAPIADDERTIAYACIHGDLRDLEELPSETEWIEFSVSRFNYLENNAFARFSNLRRLAFYNNHLQFIEDDAFAGLHRLEWLVFHGSKIHVVRAAWFRHLPNLRRLVFNRCSLVHIEPETFRLLPNLESLEIRDNQLDCLPVDELSYLRRLRIARIDANPWICQCRENLERFFRDRSIAVSESHCRIRGMPLCHYQCMAEVGAGVRILGQSSGNSYTSYWNRGGNYLGRVGGQRGNEFETSVLSSLERIPDKTSSIQISGVRLVKIPRYAFFRFGSSLRSLDLQNCFISTIESNGFAGLHKLQRLSLIGNPLKSVSADWFRDLPALQQLILQNNQIEQIERTALWHLGTSLRQLDIRDNRLRCIAIEELAQLENLERIHITGNPWTCDCRNNLQKFLTSRNIGFEITAGHCHNNEDSNMSQWQPPVQESTTTESAGIVQTGKVRWMSFEEEIERSLNLSTTVQNGGSGSRGHGSHNVHGSHRIHHGGAVDVPTTHRPSNYRYNGSCQPDVKLSHGIYTCSGISSIEELSVIPETVSTIRIVLSNIRKIGENAFSRFNGYLQRLEIRDSGVEKIADGAFAGLYNLRYLSLHSNELESISRKTLEGLSSLRHLDLSRNHIYRIENDLFNSFPYLISLDISGNSLNCIATEYMAQRLNYLTSFSVNDNPWSCLCGKKLASFLREKGIRQDGNVFLHGDEQCYSHGSSSSSSTSEPVETGSSNATGYNDGATVDESSEELTGRCDLVQERERQTNDRANSYAKYLCIGAKLSSLRILPENATAIHFEEGDLPRLPAAVFSRFPNLQEIVIRNSALRNIDENAFAGLNRLENLTIQENPLEKISATQFRDLKNLQRLDLRGNSISYIAPGAFHDLEKLEYLNLEANDLHCIFTSDLNDMPNVYIVEFAGNPLRWRCRLELEQFLESRKIRFVRVENSCEGKKLVRNLLLEKHEDLANVCTSDCSAAESISHPVLTLIITLSSFIFFFPIFVFY